MWLNVCKERNELGDHSWRIPRYGQWDVFAEIRLWVMADFQQSIKVRR